jgi:hypothetical protein
MASIINASTSGVGGVITTADNSGNLNIQSGGSTKIAVTSAGVAVTGTLTVNGTAISPSKVLQVVDATYTPAVSNSTTTYADSGLTATITPTSATSKILVIVNQTLAALGGAAVGYGYQTNAGLQLLRDSTVLVASGSDSGGKYSLMMSTGVAPSSGTIVIASRVSISYMDSPSSTSALVYKTQFAKGTSGMNIAYTQYDGVGKSTITLMEIAA